MDTNKGIIAWFARNSVAANLLMFILLVGGAFSAFTINKEIFPSFELNYLQITIAYPGAAPQEIEEGITIKVEEAIKDINGIKNIRSSASDGVGTITIEVMDNYEVLTVLDEAKLQIDAISTFPDNIEKPNIYQLNPQNRVLYVAVYGDLSQVEMKELAKDMRNDITNLDGISRAQVQGTRNYEISIEISEDKLREYRLTFDDVATAIDKSSLDLPGGSIRAHNGDILLRTKAQAYFYDDFTDIVIKTRPDGTRIVVQDVATVKDGFEERIGYTRFNGKPSALIKVSSIDDQNAITISKQVNKYVALQKNTLPANIQIDIWGDRTHYLQGRLDMMMSNMAMGALLVFAILALFLDLKLAFWVMMGLPVCFLGTMLIMPLGPIGLSINMLTLFAFILVLGIVVDDAIVIGESAYSEIEKRGHNIDNVISGTLKVAMPATFGVLTTIAAFVPMLLVSGPMSILWSSIGMVVILCLVFSLIESKLILPAHLAHMKMRTKPPTNPISKWKIRLNKRVNHFIHHSYKNFIERCIEYRAIVLSTFLGVFVLAIAMMASGHIRMVFFPDIPSDFIRVQLEMELGSSENDALTAIQTIEERLYTLNETLEDEGFGKVINHSFVDLQSRTSAVVSVELTKSESRSIDGVEISDRWRDSLPSLTSVKKMTINSSTNSGGAAISFKLLGDDFNELALAAVDLKAKLATYDGIYDISDDFSAGSQEIRLNITPEGEAAGVSLSDLARQVRYAFYGFEAQRILRNKEEVKVMVRYPIEQRTTIGHLEVMQIRTPKGHYVPFSTVASIELSSSYASINRIDGKRAITITANANKNRAEPSKVVKEIQEEFLPELAKKYPTMDTELDGASLDEQNAIIGLVQGFLLSMFVIYALMAIPLKSYTKPLIIMTAIPFGIIGALFGHWILDISVNVLSLCGIVALSGVVVNDSLILVDFVNRARSEGYKASEAVVLAACSRFRAITLTSLTTFFGLVPILLETSLQAKIVIPMATSLAFGILFSTLVTLILIPLLYTLLSDFKAWTKRAYVWWWKPSIDV